VEESGGGEAQVLLELASTRIDGQRIGMMWGIYSSCVGSTKDTRRTHEQEAQIVPIVRL
jgi:hypothetical protein